MHKHGAFLTLGMTFLSVLVLALGAAILKNAEDSETRIYELGSMDRLFHLQSSLQTAYSELLLGTFGINISNDQDSHTITFPVPSGGATTPDPGFVFYTRAHNFTETMVQTFSYQFNLTSQMTAAEVFYPATNSTAFSINPVNITYAYVHTRNAATFFLPSGLPVDTNGIIMYTPLPNPGTPDLLMIKRYLIQLISSVDGNVSWGTSTLGSFNLSVEYYGPNGFSSDSKLISFTQPLGAGQSAQNITINDTGLTTPPLISVSTATSGPFAGYGQIFIAPYTSNFTAFITVFYQTSLARNMTVYNYDIFNISSPDLGIGKSNFYRIL